MRKYLPVKTCLMCKDDISFRAPHAKYCKPCCYKKQLELNKRYVRNRQNKLKKLKGIKNE